MTQQAGEWVVPPAGGPPARGTLGPATRPAVRALPWLEWQQTAENYSLLIAQDGVGLALPSQRPVCPPCQGLRGPCAEVSRRLALSEAGRGVPRFQRLPT